MSERILAFASDHAGVGLKALLAAEAESLGWAVVDLGTHGSESVDYPDYGERLAKAVLAGEAAFGVAICGSGIGISIACNRHHGIRAAVVHDETSARLAREHNDANVLALGQRLIGEEGARRCLAAFLETPFAGGRHQRRVDKLG